MVKISEAFKYYRLWKVSQRAIRKGTPMKLTNWKTTTIGALQCIALCIPVITEILSGHMPDTLEWSAAAGGIGAFVKGWHTQDAVAAGSDAIDYSKPTLTGIDPKD